MRESWLEKGDIVLTAGNGWVSRAIRRFSKRIGESRTRVNHVGIVVETGMGGGATIVEALHRVRRHTINKQYFGTGTAVAVFRPRNLNRTQRAAIVRVAEGYVGRKYGYLKIALHWLDWALQGAYVFRRLGQMDRYPICSYLVAQAYLKGAGKTFDCAPGKAQPDDIWDFCESNPDKYELVRELRPIP